ncbi:unnamed protein product, partial [Owenia fusiformis]
EVTHITTAMEPIRQDVVTQAVETEAYSNFQAIMTRPERLHHIEQLTGASACDIDVAMLSTLQGVSEVIRETVVKRVLQEVELTLPTIEIPRNVPTVDMVDGARGSLRYVGGYTFAKVRYNHQRLAKQRVHS